MPSCEPGCISDRSTTTVPSMESGMPGRHPLYFSITDGRRPWKRAIIENSMPTTNTNPRRDGDNRGMRKPKRVTRSIVRSWMNVRNKMASQFIPMNSSAPARTSDLLYCGPKKDALQDHTCPDGDISGNVPVHKWNGVAAPKNIDMHKCID